MGLGSRGAKGKRALACLDHKLKRPQPKQTKCIRKDGKGRVMRGDR